MTAGGKRAAIYTRISKKDDKFDKVSEQEALCRKLAADEGYAVVAVYTDDGISGVAGKRRQGWDALLAAVPNREFDVILARSQDRLSRDTTDSMKLSALCADADITWHTVYEGKTDPREAVAELTTFVRGWLGKAEAAATRKRSATRRQDKLNAGTPGPGPRPFGYERWDPHGDRGVQPLREDEAELIRIGTEMILGGAPRYQVTKVFNESGVKTTNGKDWHSAKVGKVLSRWRNAGKVELNGEPYGDAIWPPIVSVEDVRNVRMILSRGRAPGRWKTPTMLCSGIARCRCGYQLVATASKVGPSYRCGELIAKPKPEDRSPGPHVTIAASLLDPLVREAVVDAYFERPASSGAGKAEAAALARVYQQQEELRRDRDKIIDMERRGFYEGKQGDIELAKNKAAMADLEAEASALAASSAHAAMLEASMNTLIIDLDVEAEPFDDGVFRGGSALAQSAIREGKTRGEALDVVARSRWADLDENGDPVWRVDPAVRLAVAERFDMLGLEQQRDLVRSLVSVRVLPGHGGKRVAITPLRPG